MNLKIKNKIYWLDFENDQVYNTENGKIKGKLRNTDKINEILHKGKTLKYLRKGM